MSSAKRGEPQLGHKPGPYYSRYTEHKFAFNFQPPTEDAPVPHSPRENFVFPSRKGQPEFQIGQLRHNSVDSPYFTNKCNSYAEPSGGPYGGEAWDQPAPLSRHSSTDGSLSPLRISPSDFSPVSPKSNLYDHPLSTFRCGSLESSRSLSPHRLGSADSAKERRTAYLEKNTTINNVKPPGKFSSILSKHSVTIFAAAAIKVAHDKTKKKKLRHSCPDLVSESSPSVTQITSDTKAGSYGDLNSLARENSVKKTHKAGNNLKVPDIFTTSFTHSKKPDTPDPSQTGRYTVSLQDIPDATRNSNKKILRRTISLTRADPGQLKLGQLLSPTMYRDEHVAQVTDYMFIGSVESAYNERRLCRLEIESLVDISNVGEMQIPSEKKTQCPCLCQIEFKHFRSRLIIAVADEENEGMDQYFEEVNRFIEGARRCSKKVLIYSYEGKSRAALFAIQYLMSYEGLLLRQAYNLVKKQRPTVSLNPAFQRTLEKLEKATFPDEKHSVNICNEYLNVADPQAIKCAWIDC